MIDVLQKVAAFVFTLGERYNLEAVRTSLGWRFSRVEVTPVWRSG